MTFLAQKLRGAVVGTSNSAPCSLSLSLRLSQDHGQHKWVLKGVTADSSHKAWPKGVLVVQGFRLRGLGKGLRFYRLARPFWLKPFCLKLAQAGSSFGSSGKKKATMFGGPKKPKGFCYFADASLHPGWWFMVV